MNEKKWVGKGAILGAVICIVMWAALNTFGVEISILAAFLTASIVVARNCKARGGQ